MQKNDCILVTGSSGLVGTALVKLLKEQSYEKIITAKHGVYGPNLTSLSGAYSLFDGIEIDYVFHLAGKVHGIGGNLADQHEAYLQNLRINTNVIEACAHHKVKKIVAMGTGAVYPANLPGSMLNEKFIFDGEPHESEKGYAFAKRAMLAQLDICKKQFGLDYAYVVSCNLYGPHDRFNTDTGHCIPSLVRKFFDAKTNCEPVKVWGNGKAKRDFMHVNDAARALLTIVMEGISGPINIGTGVSHDIRSVVGILSSYTGITDIEWETDKPNGADSRSYDLTKLIATGFKCEYDLPLGLRDTYRWYAENHNIARIF